MKQFVKVNETTFVNINNIVDGRVIEKEFADPWSWSCMIFMKDASYIELAKNASKDEALEVLDNFLEELNNCLN